MDQKGASQIAHSKIRSQITLSGELKSKFDGPIVAAGDRGSGYLYEETDCIAVILVPHTATTKIPSLPQTGCSNQDTV